MDGTIIVFNLLYPMSLSQIQFFFRKQIFQALMIHKYLTSFSIQVMSPQHQRKQQPPNHV